MLRNRARLAMKTRWNGFPDLCERDHGTGIEHTVAKQVVEFQTDAVHVPVESIFAVVQRVAFRCEHREMLHVAPREITTAAVGVEKRQKILRVLILSHAQAERTLFSQCNSVVETC